MARHILGVLWRDGDSVRGLGETLTAGTASRSGG